MEEWIAAPRFSGNRGATPTSRALPMFSAF